MAVQLSPQEALIYVMVTMSAVDGDMTDDELSRIGSMVSQFPIFDGMEQSELVTVSKACALALKEPDSLNTVLAAIGDALPAKLRETAYVAAVEVAAADLTVGQEELRFLELLAGELRIDKLVTSAIERTARARHQRL